MQCGRGVASRLLATALALGLTLALVPACTTEDAVRIGREHILYEGEPYGDFVVLGDAVRDCMQQRDAPLPTIVLIDDLFDCYTPLGWKKVLGCTSEDEVYLVAPALTETEGMLWSHELTHYLGAASEDDPCGTIAIEGFSLDGADAGASAGE